MRYTVKEKRNREIFLKEKPSKVAMTEEKTAKIEKLKTDLATKLEAGEITQEEL